MVCLKDSLFFHTVDHLMNIKTDSCVMLYYTYMQPTLVSEHILPGL